MVKLLCALERARNVYPSFVLSPPSSFGRAARGMTDARPPLWAPTATYYRQLIILEVNIYKCCLEYLRFVRG